MGSPLKSRLKQVMSVDAVAASSVCPLEKGGCDPVTRREAVRLVGGWAIFVGALGSAALSACGPETPSSNGATSSPTPDASATPTPVASGTPTPSGSPTPTGTPNAACSCGATPTGTSWHATTLTASQVPLNAVAYNSTNQVFICHDAEGFYCMDSLCPHQGCDIGTSQGHYTSTNVGAGFVCDCHTSKFDGNGNKISGPTPTGLPHYGLSTDSTGKFHVNYDLTVDKTCRC